MSQDSAIEKRSKLTNHERREVARGVRLTGIEKRLQMLGKHRVKRRFLGLATTVFLLFSLASLRTHHLERHDE